MRTAALHTMISHQDMEQCGLITLPDFQADARQTVMDAMTEERLTHNVERWLTWMEERNGDRRTE